MGDALLMVRELRANIANNASDFHPEFGEIVCARLDEIDAAIVASLPNTDRNSLGMKALIALAELGEGATPAQLGHALDPTKDGYRAGTLGSGRLMILKNAGLVRRAHFGWWVLTEAGRQKVAEMCPAQSGQPSGGRDNAQ